MSDRNRLPSSRAPASDSDRRRRKSPDPRWSKRLGASLGLLLVAAVTFLAVPSHALVVDFEDLGLGPESYLDPPGSPGGFTSRGVLFENDGAYLGFSASTTTDTTTPGYLNQYSNITGAGVDGSNTFGVAFAEARIVLPGEAIVAGAWLTNTTYAALSMRDGDPYAKKFGGADGSETDYFRILVEGFDAAQRSTGMVELMLADFRFDDPAEDFILEDWVFLDLSDLGVVRELHLSWQSSDMSDYGINTPTYVAIDNLILAPEPGSGLLMGVGLLGLASRRARRGRGSTRKDLRAVARRRSDPATSS